MWVLGSVCGDRNTEALCIFNSCSCMVSTAVTGRIPTVAICYLLTVHVKEERRGSFPVQPLLFAKNFVFLELFPEVTLRFFRKRSRCIITVDGKNGSLFKSCESVSLMAIGFD